MQECWKLHLISVGEALACPHTKKYEHRETLEYTNILHCVLCEKDMAGKYLNVPYPLISLFKVLEVSFESCKEREREQKRSRFGNLTSSNGSLSSLLHLSLCFTGIQMCCNQSRTRYPDCFEMCWEHS